MSSAKGEAMKGIAEMRKRLRGIVEKYPDRVAMALKTEAEIEMTEMKRRTPVDKGILRASGRVHDPERGWGRKISVEMSFGTDYAIFVHENLEAFHPVGQAKFMESVINESRQFMASRVAARLKEAE